MLTVEEIERLAAKNEKMPEFQSLPDMCLYECLSALYARYKQGNVNKEQAKKEKNQILKAYRRYSDAHAEYCKYYKDMQEEIRRGYEEKYPNMKGS